jgi:integrase
VYLEVMPSKKKFAKKGEGWVTYIESKQRYKAGIQIGGVTIERLGATRSEAIKRRDAVARGRFSGSFGELTPSSKVRDLIRTYLIERESDSKPSTHSGRESILRLYVEPHIGDIPLDKLSPSHISAMIRNLEKSGGTDGKGLSPQTATHARKQANAILHWAQIRELVTRNVASGDFVKSPRVEQKTRAMTSDEWNDLQKAIVDEPLRALVHLAVGSGLRRGELLGLTWDDLDLASKFPTLRVVRTMNRETGKGLVIGSPKTRGSKRTIHISKTVVAELLTYRQEQNKIKSAIVADGVQWGAKFPKMRWMFTNGIGNPIEGDYFGKELARMTDEAGIDRFSPHELRHTCASFAIAGEVGLKELSEYLGHSGVGETARTYAHLYVASRVETADKIEAFTYGKK